MLCFFYSDAVAISKFCTACVLIFKVLLWPSCWFLVSVFLWIQLFLVYRRKRLAWALQDCKHVFCSPKYQKYGICTFNRAIKAEARHFLLSSYRSPCFSSLHFRKNPEFGPSFYLLNTRFWFCLVLIYIFDECLFTSRWKVKPVNFMMIVSYPLLWQTWMRGYRTHIEYLHAHVALQHLFVL